MKCGKVVRCGIKMIFIWLHKNFKASIFSDVLKLLHVTFHISLFDVQEIRASFYFIINYYLLLIHNVITLI